MLLIGLTGGIACGKSTVSTLFIDRYQLKVIDADQVVRELQQPFMPCTQKIAKRWPECINTKTGEINRAVLGSIIFRDPKARRELANIMNIPIFIFIMKKLLKLWWENIKRRIKGKDSLLVVLDVPLLYESNIYTWFVDSVIVVASSKEQQIERLEKRNGLSREQAVERINSQMPIDEKCKLADRVIYNNSTISDLENLVDDTVKWMHQKSGIRLNCILITTITSGTFFVWATARISSFLATLWCTTKLRAAMTEWPINRVRREFLNFFEKQGHTFAPSSPVVPHNDPTLLFINAGMNQFKSLFLGTADPNTEFGRLTRATNSQLCIRAGGKHNDLDDVGRDTYHHTFFEMLGSWSFGDYFKSEAIRWAWQLLTEVYKLPKDRLYVTYFEGDPANGIAPDEEAKKIWLELVPPEQIIPGNTKDNFWEMGEVGPCGPCSEIHFDRIGGRNAASLVNKDDPMVIEIWNLVFMQFERREGGVLVPLPKVHVDTGMGLERLASIMQNVHSNYDTDAWTPLFEAIQKVTGYDKSYAEVKENPDCDATVAYRVVADHIRCLTVSLADGAMPDSVGRGFVLRRIIRRAVRYGTQFLGAKVGFFSQLVDAVVDSLGPFFTHLQDPRTIQRIKAVLADEETSFAKTWDTGLKHFNKAASEAVNNTISGENAFILHDRYGFPVDLTCLLAEKANLKVDMDGFHATMKASQLSAGRVSAAKTFIDMHQLEELKKNDIAPTDDSSKYIWKNNTAEIKAIFNKNSGKFIDMLLPDENGEEDIGIILNITNFYAESGGQIYDTGRIIAAPDAIFNVKKVYNIGGYVVHVGNMKSSKSKGLTPVPIPVTASVELEVDYNRRLLIAANHTSTHVLNWCLRRVLEEEAPDNYMEVQQKGSLVTDEMLRFDFSYNGKVSQEDLIKIETALNEKIKQDLKVYRKEVPLETAKRIEGLRQMFGEKYPDPVSVISVGVPIEDLISKPENTDWRAYAIEFCGGTHLTNFKDAELAIIISEESLMKGVRRLVVVTRDAARQARAEGEIFEKEYREIMATPINESTAKSLSVLNKKLGDSAIPLTLKYTLREAIDASIKTALATVKIMAAQLKEKATAAGQAAGATHDAAASPFIVEYNKELGADREALQAYAEGFTNTVKGDVGLFIIGADASKALAVVTLPKTFVEKKLSAVSWAKAAVGKGGGKPHAAQSGLAASDIHTTIEKALAEAAKMKSAL